jgi:internalin A
LREEKLVKKSPRHLAVSAVLGAISVVSSLIFLPATAAIAQTPVLKATESNSLRAAQQNELLDGALNWQFKISFREYVGLQGETVSDGVYTIPDSAAATGWPVSKEGALQKFDPAHPGKVRFAGKIHWEKYGGQLDVTLSNPTIDLVNKKLLADGSTTGTMADPTPKNFTQIPVVDLPDLKWEVRDGHLVISSFEGVYTQATKDLVGFYSGEKADPIVASVRIDKNVKLQQPQFWHYFPGAVKNDGKPASTPNYNNSEIVKIADPRLAHCLRWEFDLKENEPITKAHMEGLTSMNCTGRALGDDSQKITSLAGLEFAPNLVILDLSYNKISDLTPIAGAKKLAQINVDGNQLTSLKGLENKPGLITVHAKSNALTDVSALAKYDELETLTLDGNKLKNLSGLNSSLEVRTLSVANNELTDISNLAGLLWIRELNLAGNKISDISPLAPHRAFTVVHLERNLITDPTQADWSKKHMLESVYLAGNSFTDWAPVRKLIGEKLKATEVTPKAPKLRPAHSCGEAATVSIPDVAGVQYTEQTEGNTVTVKAAAEEGFVFANDPALRDTWTFDVSAQPCPKKPEDGKVKPSPGSHANAGSKADANAKAHAKADAKAKANAKAKAHAHAQMSSKAGAKGKAHSGAKRIGVGASSHSKMSGSKMTGSKMASAQKASQSAAAGKLATTGSSTAPEVLFAVTLLLSGAAAAAVRRSQRRKSLQ